MILKNIYLNCNVFYVTTMSCAPAMLGRPLTRLKLRLCGFGVALSAEAEVGQFRTDLVCRSGHKHVEKS